MTPLSRVSGIERRCHGEGEITFNPAYPDPRGETSLPCPGCPDCKDLHGFDADQDHYSETGVYDDHHRRRWFGEPSSSRADLGRPHTSPSGGGSPSPHMPGVASQVTPGAGDLDNAA